MFGGNYEQYASNAGEKFTDVSVSKSGGKYRENVIDSGEHLLERVKDEPLELAKDVAQDVYENANELVTNPIDTLFYTDSLGTAGDRKLVAQLQGNSDAVLNESAAEFGETIDGLIPPVLPARAVVNQVVSKADISNPDASKVDGAKTDFPKSSIYDTDSEMIGLDRPTYTAIVHDRIPANELNRDMKENNKTMAWKDDDIIEYKTLVPGNNFEMLIDSNQKSMIIDFDDLSKMGGWAILTQPPKGGTIPRGIQEARDYTGVKKQWKNEDAGPLYVIEFENKESVTGNFGKARKVYDEKLNRMLPAENLQFQILEGRDKYNGIFRITGSEELKK